MLTLINITHATSIALSTKIEFIHFVHWNSMIFIANWLLNQRSFVSGRGRDTPRKHLIHGHVVLLLLNHTYRWLCPTYSQINKSTEIVRPTLIYQFELKCHNLIWVMAVCIVDSYCWCYTKLTQVASVTLIPVQRIERIEYPRPTLLHINQLISTFILHSCITWKRARWKKNELPI